MNIGIETERLELTEFLVLKVKKCSNLVCSFSSILKLHLIQLLDRKLFSLILMPASNRSNELFTSNEPNTINDRALTVYPVSFDFALLTLTVFNILHNSMSEII